ncbi:Alpha galactosidase A [Dyella sp. OK004]|uniref:glycoside hydrolase family 27 protein n=1 Tax=Dyella sp. OK004 TaxID=1855292 RepID=UPI0008E35B7B|nr:glycoside hydrolase family 27 protein [Dyella sp. OK004]SFS13857.1 Alpha galactosidase A [Dyella sp. OK004]
MRNSMQAVLLIFLLTIAGATTAQEVSPTPPMGWNSWDSFGLTIDEADFKANASVLAGLHSYGWTYAVIDQGWYMRNPFGDKLQARDYALDANGLLVPALNRFPSAADGQGFKPLADWVHAQGLKFGIHIVRGVPKQAVAADVPIADSGFHAKDVADTADTCPWDDSNYGVRDTPAGQAYYDAMLALYARWGVDFLKVDCIADHPYRISEIRQIAAAIGKTGRPIVLSLSPGPTQLSHAAEIQQYGQMWRISNDVWDGWSFVHEHPNDDFPMGVRDVFDRLPLWVGQARDGHWPDADMLPLGMLAPHPGLGSPRPSRLTPDEQRTLLTLHAIARSPLILGANLTKLDDVTRGLITNKEVIAINQTSRDNHPVTRLPKGFDSVRVWVASGRGDERYLAIFNLDDKPVTLDTAWSALGLNSGSYRARDLWSGHRRKASMRLAVDLPAHGCALLVMRPAL